MLPILRIIPVGGVCIAVLIVVLALSPPREPRQGVAPEVAWMRGPLLDRHDHPEWPQWLVQAAYRRAGEVLKLRDLPDAPTRAAPMPLPPEKPAAVAAKAPVALPAATPAEAAAAPELVAPPAAPAAKIDAAVTPPAPLAPEPVTQTAALAPDIDHVKPPVAAAPVATPVPTVDAAKTDAAPAAPSVAAPAAPAAAAPSDTTVSVPLPMPAPRANPARIAVLPTERSAAEPDREEITGTISASSEATIPVEIGETSSTELPIVLPPERPPILRTIERERSSHRRTPPRARSAAKPAKPAAAPAASDVNLFEALFDANAGTRAPADTAAKHKPGSTDIPPYPPVVTYPFNGH